jgi:hypothetical protein
VLFDAVGERIVLVDERGAILGWTGPSCCTST